MKLIHISQQAIRDNTNLGSYRPVVQVHNADGTSELHYSYEIALGIRVVYDKEGRTLDGSIIRVWIEVYD